MKIFSDLNDPRVTQLLRQGAVGVIPTDTLYGVVASVRFADAVKRVYELRHRDKQKPCIVLVGRQSDVTDRAEWSAAEFAMIQRLWPGKVSIVLPVTAATPEYLHRGTMSVAYRLPDAPILQQLLQQTGPLIAPSANPEGHRPAATVDEARSYFGDQVDFYVDGGILQGEPSTLVRGDGAGGIIVLRQGLARIDK